MKDHDKGLMSRGFIEDGFLKPGTPAPEEDLHGLARNEDPETSHEAAALVDASKLIREIWEAMATFGDAGCIGDDIEKLLPHHTGQTLSPRYIQMVERGMIEVLEEKRKSPSSGRNQMVRRVLPEPHIPVEFARTKTENEKTIVAVRSELKNLSSVISRMVVAEDRVRVRWVLRRLEGLVK